MFGHTPHSDTLLHLTHLSLVSLGIWTVSYNTCIHDIQSIFEACNVVFNEEEREVKCHGCRVAESRLVSESESALSGRCHSKNTLVFERELPGDKPYWDVD